MSNPTTAITISDYMRKPEHLARFSDILGKEREGQAYVQSVLIAVSASPELMKCTPQSIMRSALRAASLGLSCDPALKQAWLVPYNKKQGDGWVKEAQFQPHYKGLYTLAMRTGKYWQMNVSPVYEGQRVLENTLTGLHAVREDSGVVGKPDAFNAAYTDVTVRRAKDKKVIGWIGYFKTKKGFEKSVYMSTMEIDDHARKYVKDYDKNPNWNDADKRQVMEMKTVLRQLLSWADMSGTENSQLAEALQAEEVPIEAEEVIDSEAKPIPMTYDAAKKILPDNFTLEQLNDVYLSDATSDTQKEAAKLILKEEYSVEPPQAEKRTEVQTIPDARPVFVADSGEIVETLPDENVNQDTGEPTVAIELISPLSDWAVNYAAYQWNITPSEAAKQIASKKLGGKIEKNDFIQIVNG